MLRKLYNWLYQFKSTQQHTKIPFSLQLHQYLTLFFLIRVFLTVVIYLWLWFPFPWWVMMLCTFSCTFWQFVYIFWKKKVYSGPLPIFKLNYLFLLLLTCMHAFVDVNPLSDTWFASIFPISQVVFSFVDHFFCYIKAF